MAQESVSKPWNWAAIPEKEWTEVSDEFVPVALRWRALSKNTVLDLGCGRGRMSLFLAELGFRVTAVDLSPDGIRQLQAEARRRGLSDRIRTDVADMLEWSSPGGSFDCILAFHSIYHTTYARLKALVGRVTGMLGPGGQLYVTFNSKRNPSFSRPSSSRLDDRTVVKTEGIEAGIPHTYLDYHDIIGLLAEYRIRKLQEVEDYYDGGSSIHFFVEAEKR